MELKEWLRASAHLLDEVFPHKPLRQWVLSFPFPLRFLLAKEPKLIGDVLAVVNRALSTYLIKKAGLTKKSGAKTGSVSFIQHFGGSLNLNIHFHMMYLDGVYTFEQKKVKFHFLTPPSLSELNNLLKTIAQRIIKLLEKRGLIIKDEGVEDKFLDLKANEPMDHIHSSSITYRIALGKYKGRKALSLKSIPNNAKQKQEKEHPFLSRYFGFSLHAGISCKSHERKKREHICRYISRPSLSEERLSVNANGQVIYKLKTPYQNGTTHIVLSPLDFLSRLSSLVPRPRVHLTRFHGVFAPHFKYRSLIIPKPTSKKSSSAEKAEKKETKNSYSMSWAKRLKRVFGIDIQICSRCGGKVKIISAIEETHVIQRILIHLGEDYRIPKLYPARGPPETDNDFIIV